MSTVLLRYVLAMKAKGEDEVDKVKYFWFPEDPSALPTSLTFDNISDARLMDSESEAIRFREQLTVFDEVHCKSKIHILPVSCELKVVKFPKELKAIANQG